MEYESSLSFNLLYLDEPEHFSYNKVLVIDFFILITPLPIIIPQDYPHSCSIYCIHQHIFLNTTNA